MRLRSAIAVLAFTACAALLLAAGKAPVAPPPKPLGFSPLGYYDDGCARCHGPQGELYAAGMQDRFPGRLLREKVDAMDRLYGSRPCEGEALDAETGLHRAWDRKQPFVAWTRQTGTTLEGEATRATRVCAVVKAKRYPVELFDGRWTWELPAGARLQDVVLEAGDGDSTTTLRLARERFSHAR